MIPEDHIAEWRSQCGWIHDDQVEQDLVLSRALVSIFQDEELGRSLALRGGTALHKLHLTPARRYSEDIDLVQLRPAPFGPIMDRLRACLDPWLGKPKRDPGKLIYRFRSQIEPVVPLRLKIETNTREHFTVHGTTTMPCDVASRWWSGAAAVTTFRIEELVATKLRALYQRKKGRDLFDLCEALDAGVDPRPVVAAFRVYTEAEGANISRANFEENLVLKARIPGFAADLLRLLPPTRTFDFAAGFERIHRDVLPLLPGDPWRRPAERLPGAVDGRDGPSRGSPRLRRNGQTDA